MRVKTVVQRSQPGEKLSDHVQQIPRREFGTAPVLDWDLGLNGRTLIAARQTTQSTAQHSPQVCPFLDPLPALRPSESITTSPLASTCTPSDHITLPRLPVSLQTGPAFPQTIQTPSLSSAPPPPMSAASSATSLSSVSTTMSLPARINSAFAKAISSRSYAQRITDGGPQPKATP